MKIIIVTSDGLQVKYEDAVKFTMSDTGDSYIKVYYYDNSIGELRIRKDYVKLKNVTEIKVDEMYCTEFI